MLGNFLEPAAEKIYLEMGARGWYRGRWANQTAGVKSIQAHAMDYAWRLTRVLWLEMLWLYECCLATNLQNLNQR